MMSFRNEGVAPDAGLNSFPRSADRLPTDDWKNDDEFQAEMLQGVSRTFALTIPQLPAGLYAVVSNAYLLCRIVDTIEDEPILSSARKKYFCQQFVDALQDGRRGERFARQLGAGLSQQTPVAEQILIHNAARVIQIFRGFPAAQREALRSCVRTMSLGMAEFQARNDHIGLESLEELDRYCYYVAGVVGQMLTRLFSLHSQQIARNYDLMLELAVSFGQGLQMTNILKDVWEDFYMGACWLPRQLFAEEAFDLRELSAAIVRSGFERGVRRLIGIAHGHLRNALNYTLLIPREEVGIRKFCLWAIGLAVLTLRKINRHLDYTNGTQVKIARTSVKATVTITKLTVQHDGFLKLLFHLAALGLPLTSDVSVWSPAENEGLHEDRA